MTPAAAVGQPPRRLAVTLGVQGGASPADLPDLAAHAEAHGYVQAWTEEANATDAVTVLAASTRTTSRIGLGSGIIPVFGRAPAVIAMEAATLHILSGGRFLLGLGASSAPIATRWRGERYVKPVTRLREYIEVVARLLSGERVVYDGETITLGGFRVELELLPPPPIHIAALGERTLRTGGEMCDGVILAFMTPQAVAHAKQTVAEGARAAGRDPNAVDIGGRLLVIVDEDEDAVRRHMQRLLAFYLSSEVYQQSFMRQGFDDAVERFRKLWEAGERKEAAARIPDELLDVAAITGSLDHVKARLAEYRAHGLRTPFIYPLTTARDSRERIERMRATLTALAPSR